MDKRLNQKEMELMKKINISKIWMVIFVMVLAGCEKLPDTDGNTTINYYDEGDGIAFTLPTSVVFNGYALLFNKYQICENRDFSGNVITFNNDGNSRYILINNLKSGTTYYCRPVFSDNLGGEKYGETKEFTTQKDDFQFVKSIESSLVRGVYYEDDVNREYYLNLSITLNDYFNETYGLRINVYYQYPDVEGVGDIYRSGDPKYEWQGSVYGKPSDIVTYWITICLEGEEEILLYTGDKMTLVCPE